MEQATNGHEGDQGKRKKPRLATYKYPPAELKTLMHQIILDNPTLNPKKPAAFVALFKAALEVGTPSEAYEDERIHRLYRTCNAGKSTDKRKRGDSDESEREEEGSNPRKKVVFSMGAVPTAR